MKGSGKTGRTQKKDEKALIIRIPEGLHTKLKTAAAQKRTTMTSYVETAINVALQA